MEDSAILAAYLNRFNSLVKKWANSSEEYSKRNSKEEFRHVMVQMDFFLRNFVGQKNYEKYQHEIMKHLLRNGLVIKTNKNSYDIIETKYNEYKNR